MPVTGQVFVTLSADLLRHLRERARTMDVPVELIVAGLVCDTIESVPVKAENAAVRGVRRVHRSMSSFRHGRFCKDT